MWQTYNEPRPSGRSQPYSPGCQRCPGEEMHRAVFSPPLHAPGPVGDAGPDPLSPEETPMDDGSRMRLLVVPHGPIEEITGLLPDGWFRVVFPFAPKRARSASRAPAHRSQGSTSRRGLKSRCNR
jgi:hypothetical protein